MKDSEKWRAVQTNDKSCDGKFFYGVRSTGIFCRPSCPSKLPIRENVVYFQSAEEAREAGFRPCKRCRPDRLEYDPAGELAAEAKAVIDHSFAERSELQAKLSRMGVSRGHLTEIFERSYGLSPEQYTAKVRLEQAKRLLGAGTSVTETAFAVGLESSAAFSTFFKKQTGMTPSAFAAQRREEHSFRWIHTPIGVMRAEENEEGITSLRFAESVSLDEEVPGHGRYLAEAEAQLREYFAGSRKDFDLPLAASGTAFQQTVWDALRNIPYGETRSYQDIAIEVGNPKAARAVGMANNRNPLMILIPCHRVVGKSGNIVGYAGGIERKQFLLDMEAQNR